MKNKIDLEEIPHANKRNGLYAPAQAPSERCARPPNSQLQRVFRLGMLSIVIAGLTITARPVRAFAQEITRSEMMKPNNSKSHEAEIRSLIDKWVRAFRNKSAEEALALHASGIVSFDIVPPL